jgi:hypothetical protein
MHKLTIWRLAYTSFFFCAFLLFFLPLNSIAQTAEIPLHIETYEIKSKIYDGTVTEGGNSYIAYTGLLSVSDSPWLRLIFEEANLGRHSFIIITSMWDRKWQKLDAISIEQWQFSSAYFNGNQVKIELHVAPFDKNIFFSIKEVIVGDYIGNDNLIESQCGPTDDRVSSNQLAAGRLLNVGCTAWIIPNGNFVSAGHCIDASDANVVEFQVPLSLPDGTMKHPGPEDQYSVNVSSKVFSFSGDIGDDWGTFEVFPNSVTGLLPKVAQRAFWPIIQYFGPESIRITGYGVDDGVDYATQQTHVGPNAGSSGTTLRYVTDTRGGNSGSPVIDEETGYAVGVHTNGGCSASGGHNSGTSFFNAEFWDAVEQGAGDCLLQSASNPVPAHTEIGVSVNISELAWENGIDAISNEIYFGTDQTDLSIVQSETLATSWSVSEGPLSFNTTYYWKVIELGETCNTSGVVWSFITEPDPSIISTFMDEFPTDLSKWTILGPAGLTNWSWQTSSNGGGDAGEMRFHWSPQHIGDSYVISDVIPSDGLKFTVEFTHFLDWFRKPFTIGFGYTTDGGTNWTTLWSAVDPPDNIGPETLTFPSVPGDENFQLGFWFSGDSFNVDDWYIDNVYVSYTVPVELTSFTTDVNDNNVLLHWITATETNNMGFEVQRSSNGTGYHRVSFVEGHGTITEAQTYSYSDNNLDVGTYTYRLKQIDFDGTSDFSNIVEVEIIAPKIYTLKQNYPNPFNPNTKIKFSLAADSKVTLSVFDILGQEVVTLVNGNLSAGSHDIDFNATSATGGIHSGVYFYRIKASGVNGSNFTSVKKMILTK